MKLISLKINGFKNLNTGIDFTKSEGISVFVGNNGSGKSNVLEAISAIFYGLYIDRSVYTFYFKLIYKIESRYKTSTGKWDIIEIEHTPKNGKFDLEGLIKKYRSKPQKNILKYLPSKIIALYSGEETRLYEDYYLADYDKYIKDIITSKKGVSEEISMSFIGKDFWNIALLTLAVSDYDLTKIIGDFEVNKILFEFNTKNIKKFNKINPNEVTAFALGASEIENLNLEIFKEKFPQTHQELYKLLVVAYLPKEESYSLIEKFDLELTNGEENFLASCLSEGQKKQILIYFVTEILADKESIVLLDEPDSYIHVGNKKRLKGFFDEFLNIRNEGEFIMTTHSPTLMHNFGEKHLFYLENGEISDKDKRGILDEITNGEMSMTDMEIFLNSKNEYLLITEGKTDKKHLELAIDKLGIENNFDIYPADGCDKLKQFLVGLPSEILGNKIIIGIFDYDDAGLKSLRLCGLKVEENKIYKISGHKNRYGISLPCIDINFEKFKNKPIEFMYSKEVLEKNNILLKQEIRTINSKLGPTEQLNSEDYNKLEKLYFFNIDENKKNYFANSCEGLPKEEFKGFKVLFDLILNIKRED